MKKISLFLLCFALTFSVFAKEDESCFETSFYLNNQYSLGELSKLSLGNVGSGLSLGYTLPSFSQLGFSARAEFVGNFPKQERLSNWMAFTCTGGVFFNLNITDKIMFRPEVSYGVILNFPQKNGEALVYADQVIQVATALHFSTEKLKAEGVMIELTPVYTLFPEKSDLGHYIGFRAGVSYKL